MENFNLGQTIRDLRNEYHYSQSQLGNLLNVTDSTVSKWESGDSNPGIEQINAMANLFGMTVRTTGADAPLLEVVRWLRKKLSRM